MKSVAGVVVNLDRGRVVYTGSAVCGQRRRNSVATGRAWFSPCEKWADYKWGYKWGYEWDVTYGGGGLGSCAHARVCVDIGVRKIEEEWREFKRIYDDNKNNRWGGSHPVAGWPLERSPCVSIAHQTATSNEPPPRIDFLVKRYPARRYSVLI